MSLIKFSWLQDYLQDGNIKEGILSRQEGLHYGNIHYMPPCRSLRMQRIPYQYFCDLVSDNVFTSPNPKLPKASTTTALLLIFTTNADLTSIEYIHIGLIIRQAKSPLEEASSISAFITYIEEDCQAARLEAAAVWGGTAIPLTLPIPLQL